MSKTVVDGINSGVLSAIRESNPNRLVLVTGGGMKSYQSIPQLCPKLYESDPYLIAWFHYYNPFPFTKFVPGSEKPNALYTWGGDEDEKVVRGHFDKVKAWSNATGIPVVRTDNKRPRLGPAVIAAHPTNHPH